MIPKPPLLTHCNTTATGLRLVTRLAGYIQSVVNDGIPASIGRPISAALDQADRRQARQAALAAATALLDAERTLSLWSIAGELENHLKRFDGVARRRVENGSRLPTELESHLLILLQSDGPSTQRRIFEELKSLT